jgi:hypothetical protein
MESIIQINRILIDLKHIAFIGEINETNSGFTFEIILNVYGAPSINIDTENVLFGQKEYDAGMKVNEWYKHKKAKLIAMRDKLIEYWQIYKQQDNIPKIEF